MQPDTAIQESPESPFYLLLRTTIAGAQQANLSRRELGNMLKPIIFPEDEEYDTEAAAIICQRSPSTLERWRSKGLGPAYFKDASGCVTYTGRTLREFKEHKDLVYQTQKMQGAK